MQPLPKVCALNLFVLWLPYALSGLMDDSATDGQIIISSLASET